MTNGYLDSCICEDFLDLLENFRKGKIQIFEFCISFGNTVKLTSDLIDMLESNLIILSLNEKSLSFSDLLKKVFDTCETYFQEAEFCNKNSEIEFKNSKFFKLRVRNYLTLRNYFIFYLYQ